MAANSSLLKNTVIYTIGSLGSRVLMFALVPLFSFYLSKKELGAYDLMITSISLFVPFVTLQISDATYRWLLSSKSKEESIMSVSTGFILILFSTIFFSILYYITSLFIDLDYVIYFCLMLITSSIFPFFQQTVRGLGNNKLYAVIGILNAFLIVLLNLLFIIVFHLRIESLFIASIIANTISVFVIYFRGSINKYLKFSMISLIQLKKMILYSLPLVPNQISWWLISAANRFLILFYLGQDSNGIFAISSRFPAIVTIINSVFILAWQDESIKSKEQNESNINSKIFDKYLTFELCMILVFIVSSKEVISTLVDSKFNESYKFMPFLYLGAAYSAFSGYVGALFLKYKKTNIIFYSSLIGGVINVLFCWILIKYMGLFAASIGTALGFVSMFILRLIQGDKFIKLNINYFKLISLTFLCVIASYSIYIESRIINYLLIILSILVFVVLNKDLFQLIRFKLINKK